MSLRTKLLVFAATLVVVPGLLYGAITVSSTRAALSRVVGWQLTQEARNAADHLAATLRSSRSSLDSFARQDVMREIRIADLDKRISSFLTSLKRGEPSYLDLAVLDERDQVVAASTPGLIGRSSHDLPAGPVSDGFAGPADSSMHGRRSLRIAVPIPDPDAGSRPLGRLVAFYDWERMTDVAARVRENLRSVGLDADVMLVDADGIVIGGALQPNRPSGVGRPLGLTDWRDRAAPSAGGGRVDVEADVLFAPASLASDLPPWTVIVSQPLSAALAPVRRTAALLTVTLAAVLIAALTVALIAARRVTRPLAELTDAAERVGRGRGSLPVVPVRTGDEIGVLAAAFNRMAVDLRRAEQELVDASKFAFVGELAAGVAHEVRTPLGVLRSSAQLLQRALPAADEEARELLQLLRDEVDRIDRVVTGLLELGRPRELRLEPSPLGQIVFRAADFAEAQARDRGVTLRRRSSDPDPVVACDAELVYQVALNLIVNAIQIVPSGGIVEVVLPAVENGYAGFEVRDDGPGIPPELRERVFEPFFTRRAGGAGLGLTFVRRVVQEHRGRVSVVSEPGTGTVFRVDLPVSESSA